MTSPVPSKSKWLHHPCLLGGPHGEENSQWLHHPYLLWGPHGGEKSKWLHHSYLLGDTRMGTQSEVATSPLPSRRSPWRGEIKMVSSPPPSQGPHGKEKSKWLHHPCLLRVPIAGRNQNSFITLAFSGSPWQGEIKMATSPPPYRESPWRGEIKTAPSPKGPYAMRLGAVPGR